MTEREHLVTHSRFLVFNSTTFLHAVEMKLDVVNDGTAGQQEVCALLAYSWLEIGLVKQTKK